MKVAVSDSNDGRGLLISAGGVLGDSEFKESIIDHVLSNRDLSRYRYAIVDFAEVTDARLSSELVRRAAGLSRVAAERNPEIAIVLVGVDPEMYGLTRMWEILVEDSPWTTMAFRSRDEAFEWLDTTVADRWGFRPQP